MSPNQKIQFRSICIITAIYDALYRYRYQKLTDPHDAYKVFESDGRLKIELELCGLDPGIYRQEIWTINRSAGSTFDRLDRDGSSRSYDTGGFEVPERHGAAAL